MVVYVFCSIDLSDIDRECSMLYIIVIFLVIRILATLFKLRILTIDFNLLCFKNLIKFFG